MADRPPIPMTCRDRPVIGGLVVPWINVPLADGGADFRRQWHPRYAAAWQRALCQICGGPTCHPAVLFGGPRQLATGHFSEPPACLPCALYVSRGCPMVAGQLTTYATGLSPAEGRRGAQCDIPGCGCGGWTDTFETSEDHRGDPAHPWYAVYVQVDGWAVTVNEVTTVCADRGCEHRRMLVNGGQLTRDPLQVVHVSEPGQGRLWQTVARGDACTPWIQRQWPELVPG